jgi:hypothetical protein
LVAKRRNEGVKLLEWRLLTNRTVETPGQAMEIID